MMGSSTTKEVPMRTVIITAPALAFAFYVIAKAAQLLNDVSTSLPF